MPTDTRALDVLLVQRVREGDPRAHEEFLRRVTSIVRFRVARVLSAAARGSASRAPRRHELLDLMQDVFVALLDREASVLGTWDPARGLTLDSFVGLVAEREALAFRRSGRRSAWAEHPTDDLAEHLHERGSPEERAAAVEELELLLAYLSERLSPQGAQVFEALYIADTPIEEICARFGMSKVAVYSFKTRLKQLVSRFRDHLEAPPDPAGLRLPPKTHVTPENAE